MEEMIYKPKREIKLLHNDIYNNFHFYILSLGTHPTAYVEIPKNHIFYKKQYWDIEKEYDINIHGGISYSSDSLPLSKNTTMENSWFIGWDYAHCFDYYCFPDDPIFKSDKSLKKWTTEEIIKDCKDMIDQLKEVK